MTDFKIADFKNHKVLIEYTKKRSPQKVLICTDDPDQWFIDIVFYKKNGDVMDCHRVVNKDLETWKAWLTGIGWEIV
jgi:hypothetical protein